MLPLSLAACQLQSPSTHSSQPRSLKHLIRSLAHQSAAAMSAALAPAAATAPSLPELVAALKTADGQDASPLQQVSQLFTHASAVTATSSHSLTHSLTPLRCCHSCACATLLCSSALA